MIAFLAVGASAYTLPSSLSSSVHSTTSRMPAASMCTSRREAIAFGAATAAAGVAALPFEALGQCCF